MTTTLADFAIVTFTVDPARLAALLPPGFEPDVVRLDCGRERAFVSAVPFRDLDFRFDAAPWARFAFGQTNYRAYVIHEGRRCVWFFGTTLATPFVTVPRYLWKLPWHYSPMSFETAWTGERCDRYRLRASSSWGAARLDVDGTGEPLGRLDGFADAEETAVVLTHPLAGYFRRRDGHVGSYSVWHEPLVLGVGVARRASFRVFERLGLVAPGERPHSVLLQRETEFVILLPPRRLAVTLDV